MIEHMEPKPSDDDEVKYDIFRQNSTIDLEVVQENHDAYKASEPPKHKKSSKFKVTKRAVVLAVIVVLLIGGAVAGIIFAIRSSQPSKTTVVINTQSLDNGTLNKITPKGSSSNEQHLTISPDTLFKSNVTLQGSTKTDGDLAIGGNSTVGGNLTVGGLITAASLSVGSLTISSINLSSNLVFGGHIMPFGPSPTARTSNGASGGSVTITGNDSAGTLIINLAGGTSGGELAIITFQSPFNTTPKVQLTPVNNASSTLNYFVTRSPSFFTINSGGGAPLPAGTSYAFDYLVTQ